ncbi:MAG: hypothetical protein R3F19_00110 [Verrucomicrobiales bacterium]
MADDPNIEGIGYVYDYTNQIVNRSGGRTMREIKDVQRAEWGDVVPVLRALGYDNVINMSWSGEIYEHPGLLWEHAEATLDLIERDGWGPGMQGSDKKI